MGRHQDRGIWRQVGRHVDEHRDIARVRAEVGDLRELGGELRGCHSCEEHRQYGVEGEHGVD